MHDSPDPGGVLACCAICTDEIRDADSTRTPCNHVFHQLWFDKQVRTSRTGDNKVTLACAVCRFEINLADMDRYNSTTLTPTPRMIVSVDQLGMVQYTPEPILPYLRRNCQRSTRHGDILGDFCQDVLSNRLPAYDVPLSYVKAVHHYRALLPKNQLGLLRLGKYGVLSLDINFRATIADWAHEYMDVRQRYPKFPAGPPTPAPPPLHHQLPKVRSAIPRMCSSLLALPHVAYSSVQPHVRVVVVYHRQSLRPRRTLPFSHRAPYCSLRPSTQLTTYQPHVESEFVSSF